MGSDIHPSTIIHEKAVIGKNTSIGPYTVVGPDVKIGDNCIIGNNITIDGDCRIGENVNIGPYTTLGLPSYFMDESKGPIKISGKINIGDGNLFGNNLSIKGNTTIGALNIIGSHSTIGYLGQDKKDTSDEPTFLVIGEKNEIREYVSIHCGSTEGAGTTLVGDHNMIMDYVHLAHDTIMKNYCIIANNTTLAGHVELGSYVKTGGYSGIHQFCRIGDHVMIGGLTGIPQDVAPFLLVAGARASVYGINVIGLKRNGFSSEDIQKIQQMYAIFFEMGIPPLIARKKIKEEVADGPIVQKFLNFLESSKRGILRKDVLQSSPIQ